MVILLLLVFYTNTGAFRRHIIVAVDCTTTFQNNQSKWKLYDNFCTLLRGDKISDIEQSNMLSFPQNDQNKIDFFDPEQDELSLFMFGMSGNRRKKLWDKYRFANNVNKEELAADFCNSFIYKISAFKGKKECDLDSFLSNDFRSLFCNNGFITEFENNNEPGTSLVKGITLSHYLYPCIIKNIDGRQPALDYILVVFSDYMTGASENDSGDRREVSYIFSKQCTSQLLNIIDDLRNSFYRVDLFDYTNGDLMVKSYKLRPKSGIAAESASLSIESDLNIVQKTWGAEHYIMNTPLIISFEHNHLLEIDSVKLRICKQDSCIYTQLLATKNNDGILVGNRCSINGNDLGQSNDGRRKIVFTDIKFPLKGITSSHSFRELALVIEVLGKYSYWDKESLPILYRTQRIVNITDICFRNPIIFEILKIVMIVLIILIVIAALGYLILNGKKKKLALSFGYSDCPSGSFTNVSREGGTLSLPCDFITGKHAAIRYVIRGLIVNKEKYSIPWDVNYVYVKPSVDANLCPSLTTVKIDGADDSGWMYILVKNNSFDINVIVELDVLDDTRLPQIIDLELSIKYSPYLGIFKPAPFGGSNWLDVKSEQAFVDMYATKRELFYQFLEKEKFDYGVSTKYLKRYFHKAIDNADHWVGIDPGTNGSCMTIGYGAIGDAGRPNIHSVKKQEESIFASLIILASHGIGNLKDSKIDSLPKNEWVPGRDYDFGNEAEYQIEAYQNAGAYCFRSIKKLLGYKKGGGDGQLVAEIGQQRYELSGLDLQSLLVRALIKRTLIDFLDSVNKEHLYIDVRKNVFPDGNCDVRRFQRAVVAIPNNYQLPQILDMVDSVKSVGLFDEVKYIYEPEGILYHYLSRTYHYHISDGVENIIVFDMGGATINATVFKVCYKRKGEQIEYYVETLSRLGYAVGGDDIDYAILEFLMSFEKFKIAFRTDEERYDYQDKNKSRLIKLVQDFKIEFVKMYNNEDTDDLATFDNFITIYLNKICSDRVAYPLIEYNNLLEFAPYRRNFKETLITAVLSNCWIKNYVYDKVEDAICDMLDTHDVKNEPQIHKIIYSGRSTMFPLIKEKVKDTLSANHFNPTEYPLNNAEVKTAVAEGACWFGMYEGKIVFVDNSRVTSSYGFSYTRPGQSDYVEMVKQNSRYGDRGYIIDDKHIRSKFPSNAGHVSFYQVMGSLRHGESVLSAENMHKVRFLTSISLAGGEAKRESLKVMENGSVYCDVDYDGKPINLQPQPVDFDTRDITKENDRPYLFSVSDNENHKGSSLNVHSYKDVDKMDNNSSRKNRI